MFDEFDDKYHDQYISQLKDHEWFGEFYTKDEDGNKDAKFTGHIKYTINRGRSSGVCAEFDILSCQSLDYEEVYGTIKSTSQKPEVLYAKLISFTGIENRFIKNQQSGAVIVCYRLMLISDQPRVDIEIAKASFSLNELDGFFGQQYNYKGKYNNSDIEIAKYYSGRSVTLINHEKSLSCRECCVMVHCIIDLLRIMASSYSPVVPECIMLHSEKKIIHCRDTTNDNLSDFCVDKVQMLCSFPRSKSPMEGYTLYTRKFGDFFSKEEDGKKPEHYDYIFTRWHEFVKKEDKVPHFSLPIFFKTIIEDGFCYPYVLPALIFMIEHAAEGLVKNKDPKEEKSYYERQNIKTFFQKLATENCLGLACKLLDIEWDGESTESRHDYWKEPKKNALEKDKKELEDENKEGKAGVKFKKCVIEIGNKFNDNIRNVLAHSSEKKYGNDSITKNPWVPILTAMMRRYIFKVIGATDVASGSFLDEQLFDVYHVYGPIPNREYKAKVLKETMSSIT